MNQINNIAKHIGQLSSTMTSRVNYRDTHFEQAYLAPIRGKPMFETIHKLWNKIKANARSVYSHLGGGTHGQLGLVLTAAQYADVSNTIFTRLAHPGLLVIPPTATAVQTSTLRDAHVEDLRVVCKVMVL